MVSFPVVYHSGFSRVFLNSLIEKTSPGLCLKFRSNLLSLKYIDRYNLAVACFRVSRREKKGEKDVR